MIMLLIKKSAMIMLQISPLNVQSEHLTGGDANNLRQGQDIEF